MRVKSLIVLHPILRLSLALGLWNKRIRMLRRSISKEKASVLYPIGVQFLSQPQSWQTRRVMPAHPGMGNTLMA